MSKEIFTTELAEDGGDKTQQLPTISNDYSSEILKSSGHVKNVHSTELYAALEVTNIPRWSPESRKIYLAVFTAFLCAVANGYDGSLMTAILAMPHFQSQFGSGTDTIAVSLIFSLYTAGGMIAAPFAAVVSDNFGRRKAMFAGSVVIIVGMIVGATAKHIAQLVVARVILGGGIVVMTIAAPAYCVEVTPPHWRGRATGFYNCGWSGGSIPAAAITFGTNYISSNLSWQLPLIFQAWACLAVMVLVFFIPESPRWLLAQGRESEAHAFLTKYHGNGDPNSALVALEIREMREGISLDGSDKRWWDYRPLFLTRSGRWRMSQVLMISIFGQFSGNGLGYFNTVIYSNLGVSSVPKQLAYNLLSQVIGAVTSLTGASLTDRMLRRPVLIFGTLACALTLAVNAGLSALLAKQTAEGAISTATAQGALAAYFLFGACYSFSYTPLQGVVPSEALETTTRAKGLALSGVLNNAIGFINSFAGPIALGKLKYKYVYVFVGWDMVETALWYLFGVEAQGRTIEELEWVYSQKYPPRASVKVEKILVA